ncbi:MAG: DUF3786 domain-containing protein [Deltaproteobacteria bacterium]|nr:DUF3786 domain-containing protein [Deltaproteobacteria bacterium]
MKESLAIGGHKRIYEDLLSHLVAVDIATSAEHLNLRLNDAGEAEVSFLGVNYLVSNDGVRRSDGQKVLHATGSALIHYILKANRSRQSGQFVTFSELAGPLFTQSSYSASALELPIIKRFRGRVPELLSVAAAIGGHQGGVAGLGSISITFDLLPHILLQLIFYDRDDEFPARATLLFDRNATQLIDFESLAVLVTLFVQCLTGMNYEENPAA